MRKMIKSVAWIPVVAGLALAGPPSGGHVSGGGAMPGRVGGHAIHSGPPALSGPTPIGAAGTTPLGAAGSLRPAYGYGSGYGYGYGYNGAYGSNASHTGNEHNNIRRRYPYGYYPGPFVMPFYGYGYDDGYVDNSYGPVPDYGPDPAQQALGEQVQRLTAELEDLRDQQQQQSGALPPSAQGPTQSDTTQNEAPITVVLHSGRQLQVKNYAVTDGVFWDFSKQPAQKIPVSAIDVAASQKATAASGGEFPPISQ